MQIAGSTAGRYDTPIQIFSSPTVAGGRVYVGEGFHQDADCHLHCLDANSGRPIWRFKTASHVESTPLLVKERSISVQGAMVFTALMRLKERRSGTIHLSMWLCRRRCGRGMFTSVPVTASIASTLSMQIAAREVWSKRVDYPAWGSPSADGDTVFFGLGNGNFIESAEVPQGRVSAHNAETGEQMWQYETEDSVLTAVAYRNGVCLFWLTGWRCLRAQCH